MAFRSFDSQPQGRDVLHLAPDGIVSSLSPALYDYVRSDAFIRRHGDWRVKGESSLVLDEHGEPAVLWHGSMNVFDRFDLSYAGENTGLSTYKDRRTGEEIPCDSAGAFFFTDNREQALTYAFLGWTNKLSYVIRCINDLLMGIGLLKASDNLRQRVRDLKSFSPSLADLLSDVDPAKPDYVSSLSLERRQELKEALCHYRDYELSGKYREGRDNSVGSPISNEYNNTVRQMEYFSYFCQNFHRLRCNDLSVHTDLSDDSRVCTFVHYSMHFFDGGNKLCDGLYIWVDRENGNRLRCLDNLGNRFYLDELTDEQSVSLLESVRDGLNRQVENLNVKIESGGFLEHSHLYPVFLEMADPLSHDYQFSSFPDKYKANNLYPTAYVAARQNMRARKDGNDGVIYRNVIDPFVGNTYGVFSVSQIDMIDSSLMRKEDISVKVSSLPKDDLRPYVLETGKKAGVTESVKHKVIVKL